MYLSKLKGIQLFWDIQSKSFTVRIARQLFMNLEYFLGI